MIWAYFVVFLLSTISSIWMLLYRKRYNLEKFKIYIYILLFITLLSSGALLKQFHNLRKVANVAIYIDENDQQFGELRKSIRKLLKRNSLYTGVDVIYFNDNQAGLYQSSKKINIIIKPYGGGYQQICSDLIKNIKILDSNKKIIYIDYSDDERIDIDSFCYTDKIIASREKLPKITAPDLLKKIHSTILYPKNKQEINQSLRYINSKRYAKLNPLEFISNDLIFTIINNRNSAINNDNLNEALTSLLKNNKKLNDRSEYFIFINKIETENKEEDTYKSIIINGKKINLFILDHNESINNLMYEINHLINLRNKRSSDLIEIFNYTNSDVSMAISLDLLENFCFIKSLESEICETISRKDIEIEYKVNDHNKIILKSVQELL